MRKEKWIITLEKFIFASRWLLAPIYVILSISLFFITLKVLEEFGIFVVFFLVKLEIVPFILSTI